MEKYLQYDAFNFSEDPDFIKWVQSNFTDQQKKWEILQVKNPNLESEINEAIEIVELFNFENDDVDLSRKENLLNRINQSIDAEKQNTPQALPKHTVATAKERSIFRYLIPIAAAACLGFFAFFNLGVEAEIVEQETGIAQTTNITLPDQSSVELNAASLLSYDEDNFSETRTLKLNGEAFFNVKKGERFQVETMNGTVEVLGTSFNVYSRGATFVVECLTGKVKVSTKSENNSVILTPNESCNLKRNKQLEKTNIQDPKSDWRKGIYRFEQTKLSAVVNELKRQFKIDVELQGNINNKIYTGFFEKKNLDEALHAITWPLGLEAITKDGKVIIKERE